jgi:hypothetical protein
VTLIKENPDHAAQLSPQPWSAVRRGNPRRPRRSEIRSKVNDGPITVYEAGESWLEPPRAAHSVSENASATEPARLLAVFVAKDGAELTTFDQ